MLRATTRNGKYITLALLNRQEIAKIRQTEQFFCPQCKETVIVRAGSRVIPHFAHQRHSDCSEHEGGEGLYHYQGKLLLYNWLRNQNISTELEPFIPEINQRPDIIIQIGERKIAIEYQCATIPIEIIKKRNEGYLTVGITPI